MNSSRRLTTSERLIPRGPRQSVLAVADGAPVHDALVEASDFLSAARDIVDGLTASGSDDASTLWGVMSLVEIAKGLVDAVADALSSQEGTHE